MAAPERNVITPPLTSHFFPQTKGADLRLLLLLLRILTQPLSGSTAPLRFKALEVKKFQLVYCASPPSASFINP